LRALTDAGKAGLVTTREEAHHATPVTVGMFAMGTMVVTFWLTFAVMVPTVARLLSRLPDR
jgi:hypothetical protein